MNESVMDMVADLVSAPAPGDRGDSGDSPRGCCDSPVATEGRQEATRGDFPGDIAKSRPKSPQVAPETGRATNGESPKSPLSPLVNPQSAQAPLSPELVSRLRKATKRVLWEACAYYRDDGADLTAFTDDELVGMVGAYLLRRHIERIEVVAS